MREVHDVLARSWPDLPSTVEDRQSVVEVGPEEGETGRFLDQRADVHKEGRKEG